MLERLIAITNSEDFVRHGHIDIKEVVARRREFDLKVSFEIHETVRETAQYECEIYCENVVDMHRVHEYKRPYNRINIYRDHPVLWKFAGSHCFSLQGQNLNVAGLMGDLFVAHDKACGNWVDFHRLFFSLLKRLNSKDGPTIDVPNPLVDTYLPIFKKHKVIYSVIDTREQNNDYSVLLFGNPEICPDNYKLGQPYIIAKRFTETVKAANTVLAK